MLRAIVALFLLTIVACGQNEKTNDQGTTFLLPWSETANSEMSLKEIHISTLRNPSKVKGPAAEVYIEPGLTDSGFSGGVADARWIKAGSVYVPSDVKSGQAVTAYAQFEKIWKMDKKMGISHLLTWPRQVSIGLSGEIGMEFQNNASYMPTHDVTIIWEYTLSGHPVALNRGILGHEHFHAYFNQTFSKARDEVYKEKRTNPADADLLQFFRETNKVTGYFTTHASNVYLYRALNEGLADFFGYVYSNDPNSFASTFHGLEEGRRLDKDQAKVSSAEDWKKLMTDPSYLDLNGCSRRCRIYFLAPYFSRQFYKSAELQSQGRDIKAVREAIASQIITALPILARQFAEAEIKGQLITPEMLSGWLRVLTQVPARKVMP